MVHYSTTARADPGNRIVVYSPLYSPLVYSAVYSEEIHRPGCSGCCKYRMLTRVDSAGNFIVVVTWGTFVSLSCLLSYSTEHNLLGIEYRG